MDYVGCPQAPESQCCDQSAHIVMDVMDEVFDKYEDWLDLPPAKIKDLISHAMMLPEEKRAQYLLLAAGRETELAELDSDTLADLPAVATLQN